jgi:hypothetical protein
MGIGSGKTHVMDVLLEKLLETIETMAGESPIIDQLRSRLQDCVYVSISFSNEMPLNADEKELLSPRILFR